MPWHILVPVSSAELGGSQIFLLRLHDALRDGEWRFSFWLFADGPLADALQQRGAEMKIFPRTWQRTPLGLWRLDREMKASQPHAIYLHASRSLAWLAKRRNIPCVERINMSRGAGAGGWCSWPWLDRLCTNWNTKIVAVSNAIAAQMARRGIARDKIVVIRNFVEIERFHRPDERYARRRALGIPDDAIVVLNLGRLVAQKGQEVFWQAARICLAADQRLWFVMAGDGPLAAALGAQAQALGSRALLLPFQAEPSGLYAAADILLHTAHWEPLANVILEAMAARLATVATNVDGTPEVIAHRVTGLLFPAADFRRAAALVLELAQDADLRQRLACAAQEWARTYASPSVTLDAYRRLFRDLAQR